MASVSPISSKGCTDPIKKTHQVISIFSHFFALFIFFCNPVSLMPGLKHLLNV